MNTLLTIREGAPLAFALLSGVLGAIVGSFLGVVAERVPLMLFAEEPCGNLLWPPSHCPVCQHRLSALENIPLVSWLILLGRCKACRTPIPRRLFFIELFTALFFAASACCFSDLLSLLSLWLLLAFLLPLALIDLQHQLLPDYLTQPLLWAGLLLHTLGHTFPVRDALYGAAAGYLSLWLVYWLFRLATGREGLGYGDFKLLAALGAWCGWQALPSLVLLAGISGLIGYLLVYRRRVDTVVIPFGPFLTLSGGIVFISQNLQPFY